MSFFAKARKIDLYNLATELGLSATMEMKIIDLKNLITKANGYDETFTKELLESLFNERIENEEREAEGRRLKEKEKEEKEAEDRRIKEEREFELRKLELSAGTNNGNCKNGSEYSRHVDLQRLIPKFNAKEDDISLFLVLFERQAKLLEIPEVNLVPQLIGVLPSEMINIISREGEEQAQNYEFVKALLLRRFKLSPEKFRQFFFRHQKSADSTWHDFFYELKNYFDGWLQGLKIDSFEKLKSLIIADQLKRRAPIEFKEHFLDQWSTSICPMELSEKIEDFENIRKTMNRKPFIPKEKPKSNWKPKSNPEQKDKPEWRENDNRNEVFERRKKYQCFECGSYDHFRPQCPKLNKPEVVNYISGGTYKDELNPYVIRGKINGVEMPILRDTGATVDIICEKYVSPSMLTGENVHVKHFLEEEMHCLPLANVQIECSLGQGIIKAAVIKKSLDRGQYILGNKSGYLLKRMKSKYSQEKFETINLVRTHFKQKLINEEKIVEPKVDLSEATDND